MKLSQLGNRIEDIKKDIDIFLNDSLANCVILCDMGGEIITTIGDTSAFDYTNIAAMAAGSYATTKGIANLLGQKEFSLLFHQGEKNNILISSIENYVIEITVFDNNAILGIVKQKTNQLNQNLKKIFEEVIKGKGITVKKAKIFAEKTPMGNEEKKTEKEKKTKEAPKKSDKGETKKNDFDSLMIDDLDDIF